MPINKNKFLKRIKQGIGIVKSKKLINPKINISKERITKIKARNVKVQQAQKELKQAQDRYKLGKKFKGSSTVSIKNPKGFLFKAEQNLKEVKKRNPSIK